MQEAYQVSPDAITESDAALSGKSVEEYEQKLAMLQKDQSSQRKWWQVWKR